MFYSSRRLGALVTGCLLVVGLAGCSTSTPQGTANGDKPVIVVGAYPFEFAASRVAGDLATVTNLLAPGADGHDLELSPKQVASVGEADLVVHQSGYQPAFDDAVAQHSPAKVLDTGDFLTLLGGEGGDHDGHDHSASDDDGHDHGGYDPHVWLNPLNEMEIAQQIAATLAEIDPANADTYRANAEQVAGELNDLDDKFAQSLTNCRTDTFVTNHAAFGYLAERYQLHQVGISGLSTEQEPSPARIAAVQQIAKDNQLTTIFYETAVSPKVAESIAGDLGLVTDVLDPLETLSPDSRGRDYIEVMNANLDSLVKANGCQ